MTEFDSEDHPSDKTSIRVYYRGNQQTEVQHLLSELDELTLQIRNNLLRLAHRTLA